MEENNELNLINYSLALVKQSFENSFAESTILEQTLYKYGSFKVTGIIDESFTPSGGLHVVLGDLEDDLSYDESRIERLLNGSEGFHRIYIFPSKQAITCFVFNHQTLFKENLANKYQTIQSILKRTFRRANYIPSNKTIKFSDPFFKSLGLTETCMKLVGTNLFIRLDFEQEIRMTKEKDEMDP